MATGKSAKIGAGNGAAELTVADISVDDPSYTPRLKEIYDPRLPLSVGGSVGVLTKP